MLFPSYHPSGMGMPFSMTNAGQGIALDQENTEDKELEKLKPYTAAV